MQALHKILEQYKTIKANPSQEGIVKVQSLSNLLHGVLNHELVEFIPISDTLEEIKSINQSFEFSPSGSLIVEGEIFSLKSPSEIANFLSEDFSEDQILTLEIYCSQSDFFIKANLYLINIY